MSENKKYYWLKLKDNFFEEKHVKALRSLPEGDKLVIIYLKMQLTSLKAEGHIRFEGVLPSKAAELALEINEDPRYVEMTVKALARMNAIEIWDDETIYMVLMQNLIGKESTVAERVRRHREKMLQCNTLMLQCNTEIEIEIEKEIDKEFLCLNSNKKPEVQNEPQESSISPPANKTKKRTTIQIPEESLHLANLLVTLHQHHDPGYKVSESQINNWAGEIEKLNRIDGRSYKHIEAVIRWAKNDAFWRSNIMSGAKLRKQFSALFIKMPKMTSVGLQSNVWTSDDEDAAKEMYGNA